MKKTHNVKFLLSALLLVSLSAFFFVNSQDGLLSEPSITSAGKELKLSDGEKSEEQDDSARIPGLFTLARLLELAGQFVNRVL
ncbi:MAG: hypothetical protein LW693_05270 [Saprospiraceae bacterium]|nr:hypothetical protein [Saprospiraceae bacterium]